MWHALYHIFLYPATFFKECIQGIWSFNNKIYYILLYSIFKGRLELNVIPVYVYNKSTYLCLNIPLISKKLVILDKILIKNSTATTLQIKHSMESMFIQNTSSRSKGLLEGQFPILPEFAA